MLRQTVSASSRALRTVATRTAPAATVRAQLPQQPLLLRSLFQNTTARTAAVPALSRPYSATAKDASAQPEGEAQAAELLDAEDAPPAPEAALKKALEAKEAEALQWKDAALRTKAEFFNLQSRSARDQKSAREFAVQSLVKDLLSDIDNLDRAATVVVPQAKLDAAAAAGDAKSEDLRDLVNLHQVVHLTEANLIKTLARHGLIRIDPMGELFDPNEHESTFMVPQPEKDDGVIFHVERKGYKLNGRIIRAAQVGVVKNA